MPMRMTTISPPDLEAEHADRAVYVNARWAFFGEASLPLNPVARQHERRGRRWLVVSYFLCPCHLPVVLALLGAAFGGSAVGAAVTGSALRVGVVLTAVYGVVLWRGFRSIRRAKRIEAEGGTLVCALDSCTIKPPEAGRIIQQSG